MTKSKFVCIFGATGSIGQACVKRFASEGWSVYLHYHQSGKTATFLQQELTSQYPHQHFIPFQMDLSSLEQLEFPFLFELDAIVFAHGQTVYEEFIATSTVTTQNLLTTYLLAPQEILKKLYPKLKGGSVVLIGSIFGEKGAAWEVSYSAAKAAQIGLMKSLAREWAAIPIRVNMIAAGYINSSIHEHLTEEDEQVSIAQIPLKRKGTAEEVAYGVSFLVSDASSFITGQSFAIDGGWNLIG
ncbi:SDR family oxidoreductase [Chryseomicrobium palamuruense]